MEQSRTSKYLLDDDQNVRNYSIPIQEPFQNLKIDNHDQLLMNITVVEFKLCNYCSSSLILDSIATNCSG